MMPEARDFDVEDRLDLKAGRVAFEVGDHLRPRRIGRIVRRHRHPGQAGMVAVGVQMKPVVMPPPYRADLTGLLQHHDAKPGRAHRRGASEPRRARTDNDGVKGWRHGASVIPGRCEASNPESRDSGFASSMRPGMTLRVTSPRPRWRLRPRG